MNDLIVVNQPTIVPQVTVGHKEKTPTVKTEKKENFICPQCGKSFCKRKSLKAHVNNVHKRINETFCKECGKGFLYKGSWKNHFDKVHRGIVNNFACDICQERYTSKHGLKFHKNNIHEKKFRVYCDICKKGFLYHSTLKEHKLVSHNDGVPTIPCTEEGCKKAFCTSSGLRYHIRAEHTENKPELLCAQCGKTFDHLTTYSRHLNFHKYGRAKYKCNICQKVISSKFSFEGHMRIHTGEKPFVCELCGIGFNRISILKNHMVVHTKKKPYACKFCYKKYTQPYPLSRHIKQSHPELLKKD